MTGTYLLLFYYDIEAIEIRRRTVWTTKRFRCLYDSINVDYAAHVANTLSQFGSMKLLDFEWLVQKQNLQPVIFIPRI